MPPLPALRLHALDDLVKQLRFAPIDVARRQLERAEELFNVITPEQTYPEDWIIFAITGYRPELPAPALVVGAALLRDLGILVEVLSDTAELTEADLHGLHDSPPQWLSASDLCERWRISRKTLDRYRRSVKKDAAILPARRVRADSNRDKLYFSLRHILDFEARRADSLKEAAAFTRLDPALEAKIVRLAAKYHDRLGWSLNRTAERLAVRFGRGHETVRQLLRRSTGAPVVTKSPKRLSRPATQTPTGAETPTFTERGPLTDRERRVIVRAYIRGVEVDAIAKRFERTRPSIYRVLSRERADYLRSLALTDVDTTSIPQPDEILRAPSVRAGLGRAAAPTLAALIAEAEADHLPDPRAERHRASACRILRAEAARLVRQLPDHNTTAGVCDEIETRLRWASRLKAELVRSQQMLIFKNLRAGLGRELTSLPRPAVIALLTACIDAVIDSVDQFDPQGGGRLAAPVGLALNRTITRWVRSAPDLLRAAPSRASSFTDPAAVPIEDWTRRVDPWQQRLEPDRRLRAVLPRLDQTHAAFLAARFCWHNDPATGEPPRTLAALAPLFNLTHHHASALEHDAIAAALRLARTP